MPPTIFSKLVNPRFPAAALGLESSNATVVHLERGRNGFALRRAASATLPDNLLRPSFDEPNITDANALMGLLSEVALSAGLAKQRKWSVALPEAATRASILTLESAPASRAETEEVLQWKYERAFGAAHDELRVSRERLSPDAQGRQRYLAVGIRLRESELARRSYTAAPSRRSALDHKTERAGRFASNQFSLGRFHSASAARAATCNRPLRDVRD